MFTSEIVGVFCSSFRLRRQLLLRPAPPGVNLLEFLRQGASESVRREGRKSIFMKGAKELVAVLRSFIHLQETDNYRLHYVL